MSIKQFFKRFINLSGIIFICFFLLILLLLIFNKFKPGKEAKYDLKVALEKNNVVPVAILGSGPAGLSAGIYSARSGFHTLVIEGSKPGGQLTETTYVENWPSIKKILGPDLMRDLKEQNKSLGVKFLQDNIVKVDFSKWPFELTTSEGIVLNALSVIIATGSSPKKLNIPGESEYWGKGVTTCAICDAPFYKDKDVIVVGGGDSAGEQVLQLSPHVKHINMFVRGSSFRASQMMQERIKSIKNLTINFNKELKKINGNKLHVSSVEIYDNKTKQNSDMQIDGVFLAIGHTPNTKIFENEFILDEDGSGYIYVIGRSQKTIIPGVFAAGDVQDHVYMQAGIASGDGIKAALDATHFLHGLGFTSDFSLKLQEKYFNSEFSGSSKVLTIKTVKEFEKEVVQSKIPVIMDFWAEHCPSCKHMLPSFENLSKKLSEKIKFIKVNIDEAEELVKKLYVLKVPAFLVFNEGKIVGRYHDFMDKEQMTKFIEQFI